MKIKMIQILNLTQIYPRLREKNFPIRLTYKISKFFNAVNNEFEFYTNELNKIVNAYGARDAQNALIPLPDNTGFQIKPECMQEAQLKLSELFNLEIELPEIKFSLDELENFDLSLDEFNYFLPFVEE